MRKIGLFLLIVGALAMVLSLFPDGILISLDFGPNFMRFVNNYLIIIALFALVAGAGAFYVGKKYPRRRMKSAHHH